MRVPPWLPNAITALRIALIPAYVTHAYWCAQSVAAGGDDQPHRGVALAALLAIGISDVLDGFLARRYGLATELGAVLDALADKLAQVSLLLFFALSDGVAFAPVPWWFVGLIVGRDLLLLAGAALVRRRCGDVAVVHEAHGRFASLLLFVLLIWVTLDLPRGPVPYALWTIAGVVLLSTVGYVRDGWRQWRRAASA